jgi:hypothetical protein
MFLYVLVASMYPKQVVLAYLVMFSEECDEQGIFTGELVKGNKILVKKS